MSQVAVLENPSNKSAKLFPKARNAILDGLTRILWEEPQDMSGVLERMRLVSIMEGGSKRTTGVWRMNIEHEIANLIASGVVGTRYGLYFLTKDGRQWAESLQVVESAAVSSPQSYHSLAESGNMVCWGDPVYLTY